MAVLVPTKFKTTLEGSLMHAERKFEYDSKKEALQA